MLFRRGRTRWRSTPTYDDSIGKTGRQRHESDEQETGYARNEPVRVDRRLEERVVVPVVVTMLDIVVQDPSGNVLGRTRLPAAPTADAVLSFPFGQVTLDSDSRSTATSRPTPPSSMAPPAIATPVPTSRISNSTSAAPSSAAMTMASLSMNSTTSQLPTLTSSLTSLSSTLSTTTRTSLSPSSTETATQTDDLIGGGSSTTVPEAPPAAGSTTPAAASGSGGRSITAPVVGGVVGGLAGIALLLALILVFLRWKKRQMNGARQLSSGADGEADPGDSGPQGPSGPMTQRTSSWGVAGVAPLMKKMRPQSDATVTTDTAPSERGFQKISGRKLESVLVSGGDGYGGTSSRPPDRDLAITSVYSDSQDQPPVQSTTTSMAVGPASQRPSVATSSNLGSLAGSPPDVIDRGLTASPPDTTSPSPPPEAVVMRPGPARQPVQLPGFSQSRTGTEPPPALPLPPRVRQDGIGRSHPSFDGSRDSRGSRFAEDFT